MTLVLLACSGGGDVSTVSADGGVDAIDSGETGASDTEETGASCSPDSYRSGLCDPTYEQQMARPTTKTCNGDIKVFTGKCGDYQVWNLTYRELGDPVWCFYDSQGTLIGKRVCTDTYIVCLTGGVRSNCVSAGQTVETNLATGACSGGVLTTVCDPADGGGQ
jgi:hypothetical protein